MKYLVTGGAGFIGTNLIKRLLRAGHSVTSIDNYSTGLRSNEVDSCNYYQTDIQRIFANGDRFIGDIDVVFHMAATARIQPSFERPEEYIDTNFQGTYEVVKYCVHNNIPLIYAGSSSKHAGRYKNPYTFSKDLGEDIIKLYQEHFGLNASIARFYNVYGPHQLTEGGYTTLIGKWLNNIENDIECEIYGTGEKRRDFTHVDDIVDALIKISDQEAYGYDFELGRGINYSISEVAAMFGITPVYRPDRRGEAQDTLCVSNLPKEILNWTPKINLQDYIKDK
tara:strand:- start:893 stop:1735 length:843 start_codon:yes stop_codon:yes gene_type:complete